MHVVGSVQAVQAVSSKCPNLPGYFSLSDCVEDRDPEIVYDLLNFFDQLVGILKLIVFALFVEVEILIPDVFWREGVH